MDASFEDFAAGQVFTSQGRTISEAGVATIAGWRRDANPVHTGVESAREGRSGRRIAHGLLGMSVAIARSRPP
ncbi:MaoC/PaaZ C-terminal domain-containing protein [Streptomyces sp. NPDC046805]|uniref:MaoC/PaaZ C-terminal domain-containing protein n=1 Tax=Streptomyces sp. NPDC046805 TaxID=3155134 RepID=UPI0033C7E703